MKGPHPSISTGTQKKYMGHRKTEGKGMENCRKGQLNHREQRKKNIKKK
jgi:hypothetical protein